MNNRDLTGRKAMFAADLISAVEEATRLGYQPPQEPGIVMAYLIAGASLEKFGADARVRPEVGPKGEIELSVSVHGGNRFIAFVPWEVTEIPLEINPRVRAWDPELEWIQEAFQGEPFARLRAIAFRQANLPDDPFLAKVLGATQQLP